MPRLEAYFRVELPHHFCGDLGLGAPDIVRSEQYLPLKIVERDRVIIDHPQGADPGSGEILDGRRTDPARADHDHCRLQQFALPLAADLPEDDMAGVTVELRVGEGHGSPM